jgi:hypothetical protein
MHAIHLLKEEHGKAKAAFQELEGAPASRRRDLWNKLRPELKMHERMEEMHLYGPAARGRPVDRVLVDWELAHHREVERAEALIEQIDRPAPSEDRWLATVKALRDAVRAEAAGFSAARGGACGAAARRRSGHGLAPSGVGGRRPRRPPGVRPGSSREGNPMARYGKGASKAVRSTMRRRKKGTLRSGSGKRVTSRKQAIAIGLSEARKKGAKVPRQST